MWPVIHPTSAVHQYLSLDSYPKRYLKLRCAPSRYPPVVCMTPFGFPVEPDVYKMNNGSSESIGSHGQLFDAPANISS